ncbi:efflux RND transporter periplasmic adaptor subunit [Marinilabiliaceae bacterium JC017]|nr:efflux RND transporter periplasmic adaptor subunit [Marinilabiliaceae bacterium JC017]
MNKAIIIPLIALLMACSAKTADTKKAKEEQLVEYKKELSGLKKKIAKLEKELETNTGAGVIKVGLTTIELKTFEHFVDVTGQVEADKNILVSPEVGGNIISIEVKEGDKVHKGQVLARLNTETIQRSIQELRISLDLAITTYQRQKNLWDQNIGSEMEFLKARSDKESLEKKLEGLEAQLAMSVIKAPINGVVDDIIQKQGEIAGPSMPFARLVNIDNVYINADVAETYLNKIKAGDPVEINFPVINKTVNENIYRTSSVIDAGTRTFRIRVNLDNFDNDIKPNLLAIMKLKTFSAPEAIVVPSLLVKKDFSGEFLFVAEHQSDKWVAKKQYVKTGIKDNNNALVVEGLSKGMKLITEGFAQVVDGSVISTESGLQ